jgi:hypothetical protein
MYNGFRGSRVESIGIQRTFRYLSTGANYTTKAATAATGTPYPQSSLIGGRKGQARQNPAPERPVKGEYRDRSRRYFTEFIRSKVWQLPNLPQKSLH